MLVFKEKVALQKHLSSELGRKKIGFVPTMGALHEGHLSLLKQSVAENDVTVISIFVNPTQFNNSSDLAKYPRTLENDIQKVATVSPDIIIFTPDIVDIYGSETRSEAFDFGGIALQMEGKHRPGHFDGVGTVVKKLFNIVKPTNAYFGEKDFQQLQIIRKLVEIENFDINIVQVPVYREITGLAMSSRNERLTIVERQEAAVIYKVLSEVKLQYKDKNIVDIRKWVEQQFEQKDNFKLEYFEIVAEDSLKSCIKNVKGVSTRAFIAVYINEVRLIDTIKL